MTELIAGNIGAEAKYEVKAENGNIVGKIEYQGKQGKFNVGGEMDLVAVGAWVKKITPDWLDKVIDFVSQMKSQTNGGAPEQPPAG